MALALVTDAVPAGQEAFYISKDDGKFYLDVSGLEDTSGLKKALDENRRLAKDSKAALAILQEQFAGIDPVKVKEMMVKLEGDGEASLIAAGKIDEVIAKRSEKLRLELQKRVDAADDATKAERARADAYKQRVLDNHIRAAAAKAGLHVDAIDDALLRAQSIFTLDDSGNAVQLDSEGQTVLGKDGKTPFSPTEWLENPPKHWLMSQASGGGANGGRHTNDGGSKTMTRAHFNSLEADKRGQAIKTHTITD